MYNSRGESDGKREDEISPNRTVLSGEAVCEKLKRENGEYTPSEIVISNGRCKRPRKRC